MSRYRIAFVLPWFGPWPVWMPLTWESCRWNPDVDWLVFTDQERTQDMPDNVKYQQMDIADFYGKLFTALDLKGELPKGAYKLCDFKPTYGAALPQYLTEYDFWGMCDLDLVWGRIREFYPDDLLDQFDILTSERCCMNGPCTLFRNVPNSNNLFRTIPNVEQLLTGPRHYGVDEEPLNAASVEVEKKGAIRTLRRRLNVHETITAWDYWSERVELKEAGTLANLPRLTGGCRWEAGRVIHDKSRLEMVLFHFHEGKQALRLRGRHYPFWRDCMIGMDLKVDSIKMIFAPGHRLREIQYYFISRFAARMRYWLAHPVRDTMNIVKKRFPRLVPFYQRLMGFEVMPVNEPRPNR